MIEVIKSIDTVVVASSGIQGNYDVTYSFIIRNIGNVSLDSISLEDDLESQFGGAFVGVVSGPFASRGGVNMAYDGTSAEPEMLDFMAMLDTMTLAGTDSMSVRVVIEIDPDNPTAILDGSNALLNIATASGVTEQLMRHVCNGFVGRQYRPG
jgi:hypothetical protein